VPVPSVTKDKAPVPSWAIPLKVVLIFALPVVKFAAAAVVTFPPPAKDPIFTLFPLKFNVAPVFTVTFDAPAAPKAVVLPARNSPFLPWYYRYKYYCRLM